MTAAIVTWVMAASGPTGADVQSAWQVAITIDDLPLSAGAGCDDDEAVRVNQRLLATFTAFHIHATGFVLPGSSCLGAGEGAPLAVARRWRAAGHDIGNHSFSHPDFNALDAEGYLADVQRAHAALEPVLTETGQRPRWFRAPMLHTGATLAKKEALDRWLARRNYRHGVVTVDNQEWVFAAAYVRAQARGDWHLSDRVVDAYVKHVRESAAYFREVSRRTFGREIPHVLLLHANRLNADHLGELLRALERDGAGWITLDEALADPAYATPDRFVGPRGLSWALRWAEARGVPVGPEPREADWVTEAARGSGDGRGSAALSYRTILELDARNREFSQAWVAGDVAALAAAYTETASIQPPPDGVLHGRSAIERFWTANLPSRRAAHRLQPTLRQASSPDVVLELGRWHSDAGSGATTGCYTVVWRRDVDGGWRMQHDAWRDANPADWACRPRAAP